MASSSADEDLKPDATPEGAPNRPPSTGAKDPRALALEQPPYDGYDDFDGPTLEAIAQAFRHADPISQAASRIAGQIVQTPVIRNANLDRAAGAELWIKAENLQHIGAFKTRGALNFMLAREPEQLKAGVVTYSSGNHGQAVAYAAQRLGVTAKVAMPVDAPAVKRAAIVAMGAEILEGGHSSLDRRAVARRIVEQEGAVMIPPFDHPDIIAGQGTATRELLDHVEAAGQRLDALLVPVGGGGLIAGAALALHSRTDEGPPPLLISFEPHGCDALAQSLEAEGRVTVEAGPTIADGLRPSIVGALNLALVRHQGCTPLRCEDSMLRRTIALAARATKLVIEASGAAALSAAVEQGPAIRAALKAAGRDPGERALRLGVMISGGNIDSQLLADCLNENP